MERARLPFNLGDEEEGFPGADPRGRASSHPVAAARTVLVVDDDVEILHALTFLLQDEGYDVRTAENGRDALRVLETMAPGPCVMLLDMMMPIMSGMELLDVLERTHRLEGIPVIVLTASASNVQRARAVLHKPAALDRILAEVASCFDEAAQRAARAATL